MHYAPLGLGSDDLPAVAETPTPEADVLQSPVKQRHQPAVRGRGGTAAAAACPDSNFVTKASTDFAKRSCPDSNFVTKVSTFVTKASTLSPRRSIAPVTSPVDVAIAVLISLVDASVDAMSSFLSACQWNVRGVGAGQKPSSTKKQKKGRGTPPRPVWRQICPSASTWASYARCCRCRLGPGLAGPGTRRRGVRGDLADRRRRRGPPAAAAAQGCQRALAVVDRMGRGCRHVGPLPEGCWRRGPRAGSCRAFRRRGDWRQDSRGWN